MKSIKLRTFLIAAVAFCPVALPAFAQGDIVDTHGHDPAGLDVLNKKSPYSPNAGRNFPDRPLFGETHLHTTLSFDAGTFGAILGPRDAYRYAKGEEIVSTPANPFAFPGRWISPLSRTIPTTWASLPSLQPETQPSLPMRRQRAGTTFSSPAKAAKQHFRS